MRHVFVFIWLFDTRKQDSPVFSIEVVQPTANIVLHAAPSLIITSAELSTSAMKTESFENATSIVASEDKTELVTLKFPNAHMAKGAARMGLTFHGKLDGNMMGAFELSNVHFNRRCGCLKGPRLVSPMAQVTTNRAI